MIDRDLLSIDRRFKEVIIDFPTAGLPILPSSQSPYFLPEKEVSSVGVHKHNASAAGRKIALDRVLLNA